ncbi:acyltransferase family protein [Sphaerimonospora cavernae]|uniref:Acyltransferase family protein n=1 Tax=Sphaerimonospora cavernae TaxID=1740611 RepID=A0ABV6U6S5_9ACTN
MKSSAERGRLAGLDGIRGLAALFVVLHHCRLMSFPGFPADTGPGWLSWLLYGHFAVVLFIVLSGFSLAVSPARSGWRLGGLRRFATRRAWRILPPYWGALAFSLVVAWTLVPQPGEGVPTIRSVVLYGLLLQDIAGSPSPNGAFWSIAVEAQLYLVFPVMVFVLRRAGAAVLLGVVTALVALVGLLAPAVPAVAMLIRLTPQFAVLFAIGIVAAVILALPERTSRSWPFAALAVLTAVPVVVLICVNGPAWTVAHFFWVDLAIGPAAGLALASVATGRPTSLVRLLDATPIRALGRISYSLYLTHAPIVVVLSTMVISPRVTPGIPAFLVTVAVAVPASLLVAWLFATVFEFPFLRHRSWAALRTAAKDRLSRRTCRPGGNAPGRARPPVSVQPPTGE